MYLCEKYMIRIYIIEKSNCNCGRSKVLIIVTFPLRDRFLCLHLFVKFSIFFKRSVINIVGISTLTVRAICIGAY